MVTFWASIGEIRVLFIVAALCLCLCVIFRLGEYFITLTGAIYVLFAQSGGRGTTFGRKQNKNKMKKL